MPLHSAIQIKQIPETTLLQNISDSMLLDAEKKYLLPILTKQLYDDISENPQLYPNLISLFIVPCLCDCANLLYYNQYLVNNVPKSVNDQLRRDVMSDLRISSSLKQRLLTDHLKTGIYAFYQEPISPNILNGFLFKRKPPPVSAGPYAKVNILISTPAETLELMWDDGAYFPNYIDYEWNYDFHSFLVSLGSFLISWGDGNSEIVQFYGQSCSHLYADAGTYTVTVFSIYAMLSNEKITSVGSLSKLKNLNLNSDSAITVNPVLTGLTFLQVLNLNGTGITTPPVLTGVNALQYLRLRETAITTPPVLTNLFFIKYLDLSGCISLTAAPVLTTATKLQYLNLNGSGILKAGLDEILTTLTGELFTDLISIDLRVLDNVTPEGSLVTDFQAAHPYVNLSIN